MVEEKKIFSAISPVIKRRIYKKKLYIQIANLIMFEIVFAVFKNLNSLKFNWHFIHSNSSIFYDIF